MRDNQLVAIAEARDAVLLPPGLSLNMEKLGAGVTLLEPDKTQMLARNGMLN